jgi:hypothetical protein
MTDLIKAAKLWAKTSQKTGGVYYVGRMGGVWVLVMENRDRQGDGDPMHFLLLGDAEAGQAPLPPDQRRLELVRDVGGGEAEAPVQAARAVAAAPHPAGRATRRGRPVSFLNERGGQP